MKLLRKKSKGFTLLEILIVLVILAVLAGLAIPAYSTSVERSRSQEALAALSATRESLVRFFAQNGTYAGATIPAAGGGTLDYNPNTAIGGMTPNFSYAVGGLGANTFVVTATRVSTPTHPFTGVASTVAVNQLGTVTRTGVYA